MATPYEVHKLEKHHTVWHSPDGFLRIEECTECCDAYLHSPCFKYPVRLDGVYRAKLAAQQIAAAKAKGE